VASCCGSGEKSGDQWKLDRRNTDIQPATASSGSFHQNHD
jgi:hypothetical protein